MGLIAQRFKAVDYADDAYKWLVDPLMIMLMSAGISGNQEFSKIVWILLQEIHMISLGLNRNNLERMYNIFFGNHTRFLLKTGFKIEQRAWGWYKVVFKADAQEMRSIHGFRLVPLL